MLGWRKGLTPRKPMDFMCASDFFYDGLKQPLCTLILGQGNGLGRGLKISRPEPSPEHSSPCVTPAAWGSPPCSFAPLQHIAGPCPSRKPGLETLRVPFQFGRLPGLLGFVSHFHHGGGSGRPYLHLPALPPVCVWEPACHKLPAAARLTGKLSRLAPDRLGRVPPAAAAQSGSCRDFPSLPPALALGPPSLPARPTVGASSSRPASGSRRPQATAGGRAGVRRWRWPKPICPVAAAPTRAGRAGGKQKGDVCFKKAGNEAARGTTDLLGLGWGFSLLTYCFIMYEKKKKKVKRKREKK